MYKYLSYFLAPLYWHLSCYSWFIDLMCFGQEAVEMVTLYYRTFIVLSVLFLLRNHLFQVFTLRFYRNLWAAVNRSSLSSYASSFFAGLKRSISSLVGFIFSPFKRKKNKKNKKNKK